MDKLIKKKLDKQGYNLVYFPIHPNNKKGYIQEHRLIMEIFLGRILNKDEVVHHIDSNKTNNFITNLMLFKNNSQHISFHKKIQQFGYTNPIKRQINERFKEIQ